MGTTKVVTAAYPDPTAFDPSSPYFDPKSVAAQPRWFAVDVAADETFKRPITLAELKNHGALKEMLILRRGNRLSVTPVAQTDYEYILQLART